MKKIIYSVIILIIASCSKLETGIEVSPSENNVLEEKILVSMSENAVSINDIHDVIARDFPHTKVSASSQYSIQSYVNNQSDTLMYIINFDKGGWKIYSSDKRTPAILAEGDTGIFSLEDGSPAVAMWISCIADDMARVKSSSDAELKFKKEEISSNKSFWPGQQLRVPDLPLIPNPPIIVEPKGHWEETITSSTIEYDSVEHMVPHWDQDAPYNACSPYYVTTPDVRAVAGCVAVAGAQVLYYLHNKAGVPSHMYSQCSCIGNVDGYNRVFSDTTSTVWASMNNGYQSYSSTMLPESILIGYVGESVNMHYHDGSLQYSWAVPVNLKSDLFEKHGISCSHDAYDEDIVKNSLLDNMPVIVSASNLMVPVDGKIHCFVIDGYRRTCTKYTHRHHFVLDEPPGGMYVMPEDYYTYTYSSPELTSIKINWGWSSQWTTGLNDGWFTLTGDWVIQNGDQTYDYNYYRKMIYGFTVAE